MHIKTLIAAAAVGAILLSPWINQDEPPVTYNVCGQTLEHGLACGTTTEDADLRPELFAPSEAGLTIAADGSATGVDLAFPPNTFACTETGDAPCTSTTTTGTAMAGSPRP